MQPAPRHFEPRQTRSAAPRCEWARPRPRHRPRRLRRHLPPVRISTLASPASSACASPPSFDCAVWRRPPTLQSHCQRRSAPATLARQLHRRNPLPLPQTQTQTAARSVRKRRTRRRRRTATLTRAPRSMDPQRTTPGPRRQLAIEPMVPPRLPISASQKWSEQNDWRLRPLDSIQSLSLRQVRWVRVE